MRFFYPDVPVLPLPPGHRFPSGKFDALRAIVDRENILGRAELLPAPPADRDDLLRAHAAEYVDTMLAGTVMPEAMRRIGLPWSQTLVDRSRATVGGAIASARAALDDGLSGQLAGGTHHAHREFGSGFCVFNDLAVASLTLLESGEVSRIAIVDTDVHQGDGNAAILGADPRVFILSVQGAKNFPFSRVQSTLDVDLPDGTGDETYLCALEGALRQVLAFRPELVLFLSGADALAEDRLGRLSLTHAGLMARDRLVLGDCKSAGVPVAIAIGGGYGQPIETSVQAYANTFRVAASLWGL